MSPSRDFLRAIFARISADAQADVFETEPSTPEPAIDLKVLHAKIGELTLANDFLSGALGKAELLPSAKR